MVSEWHRRKCIPIWPPLLSSSIVAVETKPLRPVELLIFFNICISKELKTARENN